MARRPPASANPASAHFLAKPHFHPNVTFGDFTGTHPRARIGFRREFLPGTCTVHRTSHSPFPDTWSFSFSRNGPCRPSAFCRLRLKRHASRNPSLHGHYPLHRYYGSIRLLPPLLAQGQVSQVPDATFQTRRPSMPRHAFCAANRLRRFFSASRRMTRWPHGVLTITRLNGKGSLALRLTCL